MTEVAESGILAGPFSMKAEDLRFGRLFLAVTTRPPTGVPRITTVRTVALEKGTSGTMVGLTTYTPADPDSGPPRQVLTFFSNLLDELSDQGAMAVMAHELAHAWLNEHQGPEESRKRELEADALARDWGFGPELDALNREADTVGV